MNLSSQNHEDTHDATEFIDSLGNIKPLQLYNFADCDSTTTVYIKQCVLCTPVTKTDVFKARFKINWPKSGK